MPTDHEVLCWLYERRPAPAPPPDDDLGDPADFEPIYLATLEEVAEHADSDHDRLSALFLLSQYNGYDSVQDRLVELTEATKSDRVILTAFRIVAQALGLLKILVRGGGSSSPAPRLPSVSPPTPRSPRLPRPRLPALPWPRLPIPRRRRARKQPQPAVSTPPPIPETIAKVPSEPPPAQGTAFLETPPYAGGLSASSGLGGRRGARAQHNGSFATDPILGGDTEGGAPKPSPTPPGPRHPPRRRPTPTQTHQRLPQPLPEQPAQTAALQTQEEPQRPQARQTPPRPTPSRARRRLDHPAPIPPTNRDADPPGRRRRA